MALGETVTVGECGVEWNTEVRVIHIGSFLLTLWLVIGGIAAAQRHEFTRAVPNCNTAATIGVTILAGPINYIGLNPKISCHDLPQPSQ